MNKIFNKNLFRNIDWPVVILVFIIAGIGITCLANASVALITGEEESIGEFIQLFDTKIIINQVIFFFVSLVAVVVLLILDYSNLRDYSNIIYIISVLALIAVRIFGSEQRGTTGWFIIGGFGIQPSEFVKITLLVVLAQQVSKLTEGNDGGISTMRQLFPALWRFLIPFFLVASQPDLGTALVYAFIFMAILLIAKTKGKIMAILGAGFAAMAPIAWFFLLKDYQRNRLLSFINPDLDKLGSGYNISQSKISVGSGQMWGKGLFAPGNLSQTGFVPEQQNDFIFSATTEAVGFIGSLIIIVLFFTLMFRFLKLSTQAKDDFGSYIIIGVTAMLLFHVFENIGMNIGIMPITGIPLPLMSSGGSNMLATMLGIGLVLNVNMRKGKLLTYK